MNWPLASDYQDAVQSPGLCFQDPQLKAGHPVLNRLGLPRVASGTFASVYEVRNGNQRWAVRCFLRPSVDQQKRYALLSQYLGEINMPGLVGFAYETQGIRVKGQWFPIVKMEWVDGATLHTYISHQLQNPDALRQLARQWRDLLAHLRAARLAHADLQHGNVLVTPNGELRLVDYDGMFVPSLEGKPSHELGHPNYQHPQRTAQNYDDRLDDFSALVVYASLVALIYDPSLWERFHTGENLIFSASDFKAPQKSPVFECLYRSKEPLVHSLSQKLAQACVGKIQDVPDFGLTLASLPALSMPPPWWKGSAAEAPSPPSPPSHDAKGQAHSPSGPTHASPQPYAKGQHANHVTPANRVTPPDGPLDASDPSAQKLPGWLKGSPKPQAAAPLTAFFLSLQRLWQEAGGTPARHGTPSISLPPTKSSTPPLPAQRRASAKEPRSARWRTCTSVTCLFLCLSLFVLGLLAQVVIREVQTLFAAAPQTTSRVPTPSTPPAARSQPASVPSHKTPGR